MNQAQKGERYNWLLQQHKNVENQIIIEGLNHRIALIDLEVKKLF